MTNARSPNGLIFIDQIVFQACQRDVVNRHIWLIIRMVTGVKRNVGARVRLQRETVVFAAVPLANQVGNIIVIPCAVRLHVLIIQRFVVQRRGVVVGDGLAVPVPQHFFQVDGGLRCRCRFRFDIENRFRDVIRRINFRQSRRKELILFPNENAPRCAANFSRCLTRMERSVAALR